tara:strand:+ start:564 stop:1307 length:744 start_codon:yes stop_codon:yes gene_type:complete
MLLKEKVILITGSTRGIGLAIAKKAAREGAHIIVSGRNQENSEKVASELAEEFNINALGVACNVSDVESCQNLVSKAIEKFSKIDILVNNAGITKDNLLLRMKDNEWEDVINTNLNSIFYMTKAVSRPMIKNKKGKVINISSIVGITGNSGQTNYAATKAGMIGFTKSVAKELGGKGITCNAIAPGFIETDMIETLPKEYISNIISKIPLKRLGNTEDVSDLVIFLASDKSNYITGQILSVDGGMNM